MVRGDDRGQRTINAAEAENVRRVFREYLAGKGPLAIVRDFNREGIPGPTGKQWNASALLGSAKRRNGMLNNELYRGVIVYNRQRFIKDPDSGKRIARENPECDWLRQEAPHLRIIEQDVWGGVQRRRAEQGGPHLYQKRRPKRPLSGLIYCGACGSRYIIATHDYLRCSARMNSGTCDCSRTIEMAEIEQRVLGGLRQNLLASDKVADSINQYIRERARLADARRKQRNRTEADLIEVKRKIDRMLKMVEDGHAEPHVAGPRLNALDAERRQHEATLATEPERKVMEVFPNAAERYAEGGRDPQGAFKRQARRCRSGLAGALADPKIVVKEAGTREPLGIEVVGTLAVLMKSEDGTWPSDIVRCVPPQPIFVFNDLADFT